MEVNPGGSGFTVDPGLLTAISSDADSIAAALAGPAAIGVPEAHTAGGGANSRLATGGALTSCTTSWEAHLRDTMSRVRAVGGLLDATAKKYASMDGNAAAALPARG